MSASSPADFPVVPIDITREAVLAKCGYYAKVGLWPTPLGGVDPRAWLENFTTAEERHAVYLLNAFLYFSNAVIDRVFVAACHAVSHSIDPLPGGNPAAEVAAWNTFLEALTVTAVRGERPSATDSGALFTRRARHRAGFEKRRILDQAEAIAQIARHAGDLLFVDDFMGTGNQFADTFRRRSMVDGHNTSFEDLRAAGIGRYFYCPVAATARGVSRIEREFPGVVVSPGHVLTDRYSVLHPDSLVWPDDLRATARDFVYDASMRAGVPDSVASQEHWEGFGRQGLALAFEHGAPDATIPLIWWERNNWVPLRGRG